MLLKHILTSYFTNNLYNLWWSIIVWAGALESLPVTFEGKNYILQDVGQVVRKNPKTIVINMAAFPQVIPAVIQAISKSGMNLNPQQDGTTLYVPIPKWVQLVK